MLATKETKFGTLFFSPTRQNSDLETHTIPQKRAWRHKKITKRGYTVGISSPSFLILLSYCPLSPERPPPPEGSAHPHHTDHQQTELAPYCHLSTVTFRPAPSGVPHQFPHSLWDLPLIWSTSPIPKCLLNQWSAACKAGPTSMGWNWLG